MILKILIRQSMIWLMVLMLAACGQNERETVKAVPAPEKAASQTPAAPASKKQEAVAQKTRDIYQWYCTQCHGLKGKGDGINAKHLTVPPRDHTKAEYLETRTDRQLFDAISLGGLAVGRAPCMPAWGKTLDEETIRSLVRYIRELCECEAL